MVIVVALCGIVVMEGVITPHGIVVGGWAVVGPEGRGWLCVCQQREW